MSSPNRRSNLHEEEGFEKAVEKGGPFDVGPNELDEDIGRHVRFPEAETDPENESAYNHEHVIVAVQKDHEGRLCYRVQLAEDIPEMGADEDLGRVAHPSEVEFVEEEDGTSGR
jgi:hypothetical protein